MIQTSLKSDFDGSYLCIYSKKQIVIRSGTTQSGTKKRWNEHISASICATDNARSSCFYSSYPSLNCKNADKPKQSLIRDNLQQIVQLVGEALHRINEVKAVGLLDGVIMKLRNLMNSQLLEVELLKVECLLKMEKYRHMCYMFELASTLCIASEKKIQKAWL